ncbi:MAG: oxidoreductase [Gammaproteobacteria bacterium]|nr:oxidoreductase [Gammaproteobacteria bacterium]
MKNQPTIVTHEMGMEAKPLPTWTDDGSTIDFDPEPLRAVIRTEIPKVPGAFQLLNVLSPREADVFVEQAEQLGFHKDSPVSLPHSVRHNENLNWVVSEKIDNVIWQRSKNYVSEEFEGQTAKGINARFRFYRYGVGDFFKPHTDGSWPGSRVINGKLIVNAYPLLFSQFSYLLFLNDDYTGGRTQFLVSKAQPDKPATSPTDTVIVNVETPKGAALCFPHGMHPLHCVHSGESILSGTKYIIRTDILFGD